MSINAVLIIVCVLSIAAGYLLAVIRYDHKIDGILRVDTSDEDGPYLFVELNNRPDKLEHGRYVRFMVNKKNYISHE